jgi:hypothetical protein
VDKDYAECMEEMKLVGCPHITEVEFDCMPTSVKAAMDYLIAEHNTVAEEHTPQSTYATLSKIRVDWKKAEKDKTEFFDDKGEITNPAIRRDIMLLCKVTKWDNLRTRLNTATCSDMTWALLERIREKWEKEQEEEGERKAAKGGKGAKVVKKHPEFAYTLVFRIFASTIPEPVRISCLRALLNEEINKKQIENYIRAFQGRALVANTIVDHVR